MRLAMYGWVSTALTTAVLYTTFYSKANFYTSAIQLSKSSPSLLILLNFGIFCTLMVGKVLQAIFFGPLRAIEVEHLYERSWFAVTETCLAMTIFRDEFDTQFVILFISLLFVKIFHWLYQDRIDFMEQSAQLPFSFHIRMVVLMIDLLIVDLLFVFYSVEYTLTSGPSMLIVFGFEYAILAAAVLATFSKYVLHVIDSRTTETWENKSLYIFYLELVIDFMKLVIYVIFFVIVLAHFGVPLHIIRDIYVTLRSFLQKCRDLVRYRQATRNMNERYPDATREELARMSDPTCIICREDMVHREELSAHATPEARTANASEVPKKLPCGHIFHFNCLRSWLERQQSCPTCRSPVLNDHPSGPPNDPPTPPLPPVQPDQPLPPTPRPGDLPPPPTSSPHGSASGPTSTGQAHSSSQPIDRPQTGLGGTGGNRFSFGFGASTRPFQASGFPTQNLPQPSSSSSQAASSLTQTQSISAAETVPSPSRQPDLLLRESTRHVSGEEGFTSNVEGTQPFVQRVTEARYDEPRVLVQPTDRPSQDIPASSAQALSFLQNEQNQMQQNLTPNSIPSLSGQSQSTLSSTGFGTLPTQGASTFGAQSSNFGGSTTRFGPSIPSRLISDAELERNGPPSGGILVPGGAPQGSHQFIFPAPNERVGVSSSSRMPIFSSTTTPVPVQSSSNQVPLPATSLPFIPVALNAQTNPARYIPSFIPLNPNQSTATLYEPMLPLTDSQIDSLTNHPESIRERLELIRRAQVHLSAIGTVLQQALTLPNVQQFMPNANEGNAGQVQPIHSTQEQNVEEEVEDTEFQVVDTSPNGEEEVDQPINDDITSEESDSNVGYQLRNRHTGERN